MLLKLCENRIVKNILLTLIVIAAIIGMFYIRCHRKPLQIEFEKLIREEDLSLTIYYMSPFVLLRHPLSDTQLMNGAYEHKIMIPSNKLKEHIDLLNQINNKTLRPVVFKSYQDTRLIYVFETKKDGKILSVSIQAGYSYMYVNGCKVKVNKLFYEIVMPFLPDDAVEQIRRLVKDQNS